MVAVYERAVVAPVTLIMNILQRVASRSYSQAVERAVVAPVTLIMNILLSVASRSSENDTKNPRPGKVEDFSVARKSISHVLMFTRSYRRECSQVELPSCQADYSPRQPS
jgi:hypothetical protein